LSFSETTTNSSDFVSVRIAYIGCIEVWTVMQPQAWRTVGTSAVRKSSGMEIVNRLPGAPAERNHAAVACGGRLLIKWLSNPKGELASAVILVDSPSGGDAIPIRIAGDAA
jgi:hypothetical protein